jgi:hypothetical protein
MDHISDFETFYNVKIRPQLPRLKKLNNAAGGLGVAMVILILFAVASLIATVSYVQYKKVGIFITIALVISAITSIVKYLRTEKKYIADFKKEIITAIIDFFKVEMTYAPQAFIPVKDYKRSGLLRNPHEYYQGEDLFKGIYKGVSFCCAEVNSWYTKETNRAFYDVTIFKGLLFIANVRPVYKGFTYVYMKDNDQLAKSMKNYSWFKPPANTRQLVLNDYNFDAYFNAYSTDEKEGFDILNSDMRQMMVNFMLQINRRISFSVVDGQCYLTIPIRDDLFEPSTDPTDKDEIKQHFFSILLILSIINQLDLNRLSNTNVIQ